MTNNTHDSSELNQAVESIDSSKLAENLNKESTDGSSSAQPKPLNDEQQTPFIDESVRTDKQFCSSCNKINLDFRVTRDL